MGTSKTDSSRPQLPGPAPTSSSAHTLQDIPTDAPPPYSDELESALSEPLLPPTSNARPPQYPPTLSHPPLPSSRLDTKSQTIWTNDPLFSSSAIDLQSMLTEQALFPPHLSLRIQGSHQRYIRDSQNRSKQETHTDFDFTIDMTPLLSSQIGTGDAFSSRRLRVVSDARPSYRGGITRSLLPHYPWEETRSGSSVHDALAQWCRAFVSDGAGWKSFTFRRRIEGMDTAQLRAMAESAVRSTGYMGHVHVDFEERFNEIVVLSPGRINALRTMVWVRWLFYLSFLWVVSWPVLFLLTKKYEVVSAVFEYRAGGTRYGEVAVQDEMEWFAQWERSIQRAAWGRVRGEIDWRYRQGTGDMDDRAAMGQARVQMMTGNAAVDGLAQAVGMGFEAMGHWDRNMGWGRDEY
ncbi:Hypothetical protein D9617_11g008890 [Elsinoe fawcettii]|nr:Hypothetical protein D9617_11g008890 [Elsinoe fawcettii]